MNHYLIACSKIWDEALLSRLQQAFVGDAVLSLITHKNDLTLELLDRIKPKYIFFPHWSYLIPEAIFQNYECVIFHMTDLPFGRGGSPLQNLISRGIEETKISALRCVKELDAGPIYMKVPLSLNGSAQEIYSRAIKEIEKMIVEMIQKQPTPVEQIGEPTLFKRRTPEQSKIGTFQSLQQLYDHIRMLDAEGYPRAFLEVSGYRYEFSGGSLNEEKIVADVTITRINDHGK